MKIMNQNRKEAFTLPGICKILRTGYESKYLSSCGAEEAASEKSY